MGRVFTRLLGYGARGADTPVGDASYCRRGSDCAPTTGARVAGVTNGIVVQVVQAGERQATRWAHLYLRYRVRRGNMSRGSCYRARRRPPWIVSPLTRNSLAGAARSWPMSEAESERRVDRMLRLTCVLVLRRLPRRPWSCGPCHPGGSAESRSYIASTRASSTY